MRKEEEAHHDVGVVVEQRRWSEDVVGEEDSAELWERAAVADDDNEGEEVDEFGDVGGREGLLGAQDERERETFEIKKATGEELASDAPPTADDGGGVLRYDRDRLVAIKDAMEVKEDEFRDHGKTISRTDFQHSLPTAIRRYHPNPKQHNEGENDKQPKFVDTWTAEEMRRMGASAPLTPMRTMPCVLLPKATTTTTTTTTEENAVAVKYGVPLSVGGG